MKNANADPKKFNADLQKHLRKCELEYRAKMIPGASCVDWLGANCNSVEDISRYLRAIGFKIRRIVDEKDTSGDTHRWVETTNGVIVYVNDGGLFGLVAAAKRLPRTGG